LFGLLVLSLAFVFIPSAAREPYSRPSSVLQRNQQAAGREGLSLIIPVHKIVILSEAHCAESKDPCKTMKLNAVERHFHHSQVP
jgi:hypothetical protein